MAANGTALRHMNSPIVVSSDPAILRQRLVENAIQYLSSLPGPDTTPENKDLHQKIRILLRFTEPLTQAEMINLEELISYRINDITSLATQYKNQLKIDFLDCEQFDMSTYGGMTTFRFGEVEDSIWRTGLFIQSPVYGDRFHKGARYLAAALLSTDWQLADIKTRLERLVVPHVKPVDRMAAKFGMPEAVARWMEETGRRGGGNEMRKANTI